MSTLIDLTGQKFGRLTVMRRAEVAYKSKDGGAVWYCQCDCGNEANIRANCLKSGCTTSCGCAQREIARENGIRRGGLEPGQAAFHDILYTYKRHAKTRGLAWNLLQSEFKALIFNACFYCGTPPCQLGKRKKCNGFIIYNGVDRKNNGLGYEPTNCVSCCWKCNHAKGTMSIDEFRQWISVAYRKFARFHDSSYSVNPESNCDE